MDQRRPADGSPRASAARRGVSGRGPWPFASTFPPLPSCLRDGRPWPKFSIITPSFNQAAFIEETILSVANQGYPNVEHIIIDGGSTDGTLEILGRYRHRLAHVVSEKDRGQSHALNKGFARAGGDILTWLNSDDMLAPGALAATALALHTSGADVVAGMCQLHKGGRLVLQHLTGCAPGPLPLEDMLDVDRCWFTGQFFFQPEVLFTRRIWEKAGGQVDESLFYSMDYEMWLRFAEAGARLHVIGRPTALFRLHDDQKTAAVEASKRELVGVRDNFLRRRGRPPLPTHPPEPHKIKLRIACINDLGLVDEAGLAGHCLATALAQGNHHVSTITLKDPYLGSTSADILRHLSEHEPDVVVQGRLDHAGIGPDLPGRIAARWPVLALPVFPPVPTELFHPRDRQMCRELLHWPQDRFIILTTGEDAAALETLAEALKMAALPDVECKLVRVSQDLRPLAWAFAAADLFACASDRPGATLGCVLAAASGTPVVASPCAALREVVVDGLTGRVAAETGPAALARALAELYAQPLLRADLAGWALRHAGNEWSSYRIYHCFVHYLIRLGLRERLGLPRSLTLPLEPEPIHQCTLTELSGAWQRTLGFGRWQAPDPERNLPAHCWALGPASRFVLHAEQRGFHQVVIRCANYEVDQRLRLLLDHHPAGECPVPVSRTPGEEQILEFTVELGAGDTLVELAHARWSPGETEDQQRALLILGIHCWPVSHGAHTHEAAA
jgi:glycosyltransferase involved in cell wall biosynthesis